MTNARRVLQALALAMVLSACADDSGAPTPSPLLTPTPAGRAAVIYVLNQPMVPGYRRSVDIPLNPTRLASENALPSLQDELNAEGFINGARVEFTPPPASIRPLAFANVSSQAIIFGDGTGASRYFAAESGRLNTASKSATLAHLTGLPRGNVDDLLGLQSALPAPAGVDVEVAFIALLRRGRVVTQLFARGTSASLTNIAAFLPLLTSQESLLVVPPGF